MLSQVSRGLFISLRMLRISSVRPCTAAKVLQEFSVTDKSIEKYLSNLRVEFYRLKLAENVGSEGRKRMQTLSPLVEMIDQRKVVLENMKNLEELKDEKDQDMIELMKEEKQVYGEILEKLDADIISAVLDIDDVENYRSLMVEVTAGVGGQEAMLFARELFEMYSKYCLFKGWEYELLHLEDSDAGGIRHGTFLVTGNDAFRYLRHEGGVHRVQRVPLTEKSGRIHTSTVTVAVIPRPEDLNIDIQDRDLRIETKRSSGAGGQSVNTTDSAVRIVHLPTGIAVECQNERSQIQNKKIALQKLKAKLIQQHVDKQTSNVLSSRKSQVGSSNRNEKIRTFNYNQDRVTDHRIEGGTKHNLKGFLNGGQDLDDMIGRVHEEVRRKQLVDIIRRVAEEK